MKLELKRLAPYLPYELDILYDDGSIRKLLYLDVSFLNDNFKALLIPLSELPKQAKATVVGIRNIDQINSKCCYLIYHKDGETYFDDLPEQMAIEDVWDTYEQLFAEHYDVFGLIEQGLALNKLEYGQSK